MGKNLKNILVAAGVVFSPMVIAGEAFGMESQSELQQPAGMRTLAEWANAPQTTVQLVCSDENKARTDARTWVEKNPFGHTKASQMIQSDDNLALSFWKVLAANSLPIGVVLEQAADSIAEFHFLKLQFDQIGPDWDTERAFISAGSCLRIDEDELTRVKNSLRGRTVKTQLATVNQYIKTKYEEEKAKPIFTTIFTYYLIWLKDDVINQFSLISRCDARKILDKLSPGWQDSAVDL